MVVGGAINSFRNVCGRDGCKSLQFGERISSPELCFFDFVGVHGGPRVDQAMRLQKTNASTVPPENVPQIGTALEAMQVWKVKQFSRSETLLLWLSLRVNKTRKSIVNLLSRTRYNLQTHRPSFPPIEYSLTLSFRVAHRRGYLF